MPLNTLLLVSANPRLREVSKLSFASLLVAGTNAEALTLAARQPPDAILLDASLPGLEPAAFLAQLPALKLKVTPVVMLIQRADAPVPPGIAGSIAEPVDAAQFAGQVRDLFEEGRYQTAFTNLFELGGDEFVVEMIDLFLQAGGEKLEEARQSFAAGDLVTLGRAVHSLKSSAANLGADALSDLCRQAEQHARQEEAAPIALLLPRIDQAFTAARTRLLKRKTQAS